MVGESALAGVKARAGLAVAAGRYAGEGCDRTDIAGHSAFSSDKLRARERSFDERISFELSELARGTKENGGQRVVGDIGSSLFVDQRSHGTHCHPQLVRE